MSVCLDDACKTLYHEDIDWKDCAEKALNRERARISALTTERDEALRLRDQWFKGHNREWDRANKNRDDLAAEKSRADALAERVRELEARYNETGSGCPAWASEAEIRAQYQTLYAQHEALRGKVAFLEEANGTLRWALNRHAPTNTAPGCRMWTIADRAALDSIGKEA